MLPRRSIISSHNAQQTESHACTCTQTPHDPASVAQQSAWPAVWCCPRCCVIACRLLLLLCACCSAPLICARGQLSCPFVFHIRSTSHSHYLKCAFRTLRPPPSIQMGNAVRSAPFAPQPPQNDLKVFGDRVLLPAGGLHLMTMRTKKEKNGIPGAFLAIRCVQCGIHMCYFLCVMLCIVCWGHRSC